MKRSKSRTKSAGKTRKAATATNVANSPKAAKARDPRLPAPGTTIVRPYKGKEYRVTVLEEGFKCDGQEFRSLSSLASHITGFVAVNGYLWIGLTKRPAATEAASIEKPAATKKPRAPKVRRAARDPQPASTLGAAPADRSGAVETPAI